MNLSPDKIPTDATAFRKWADAACVDWPGGLQVLAYRAWRALEGHPAYTEHPYYEMFLEAYVQRMRMEKSSEKVA